MPKADGKAGSRLKELRQDSQKLFLVPPEERTWELCLAAVGASSPQDARPALAGVPDALRTEDMCFEAVGRDGRSLAFVPPMLRTKAVCERAVQSCGRAIFDVPAPLRSLDLCLAAGSDPQFRPELLAGALKGFLPEKLEAQVRATVRRRKRKEDAEWLRWMRDIGAPLAKVPEGSRTVRVCEGAVEQDACALHFVPDAMKTEALCRRALSMNMFALKWVPKRFLNEGFFCRLALAAPACWESMPEEFCTERCRRAAMDAWQERMGDAPEELAAVPAALLEPATCFEALRAGGDAAERLLPEALLDGNGMPKQGLKQAFACPAGRRLLARAALLRGGEGAS